MSPFVRTPFKFVKKNKKSTSWVDDEGDEAMERTRRFPSVTLRQVFGPREPYLSLLLLADEAEEVVRSYIGEGDLYEICIMQNVCGVVQILWVSEMTVEIKNIAIVDEWRNRGLGRQVIEMLCRMYAERGVRKMVVGTGNSSIGNIAFYQKAGFRITGVRKDYFLDYPRPIYEFGIRCIDMVMFERDLTPYTTP
jgi:ribosomal protein S18 acetylase RimI-like enzyme